MEYHLSNNSTIVSEDFKSLHTILFREDDDKSSLGNYLKDRLEEEYKSERFSETIVTYFLTLVESRLTAVLYGDKRITERIFLDFYENLVINSQLYQEVTFLKSIVEEPTNSAGAGAVATTEPVIKKKPDEDDVLRRDKS